MKKSAVVLFVSLFVFATYRLVSPNMKIGFREPKQFTDSTLLHTIRNACEEQPHPGNVEIMRQYWWDYIKATTDSRNDDSGERGEQFKNR